LMLAAAWAVVVVPLTWGVCQTAVKALPLFKGPAAPAGVRSAPGANPEKPPRRLSTKQPADSVGLVGFAG
jgi:hypothetical protein